MVDTTALLHTEQYLSDAAFRMGTKTVKSKLDSLDTLREDAG